MGRSVFLNFSILHTKLVMAPTKMTNGY